MIRPSFLRTVALSTALLVAVCPSYGADPPPASPSTAQSDEADALFRRGNDLYKQQRYGEAKTIYEMAFGLKQTHDIAANLGYAELNLQLYRDAAEHLSFAVDHWPPTGKIEKRRFAEERLDAAKKEVATLTIEVNVDGAAVLVDGKEIGVSPIARRVFAEPGSRSITATLEGHKDGTQVLQTKKGEELTVSLQLEALPKPPAAAALKPQQPERGVLVLGHRRDPRILIAGGATTGVTLVLGVIFAVAANGEASDAEERSAALARDRIGCPGAGATGDCLALHDALASKDALSNLAFWSFVGAGVAAAGTAVYALLPAIKLGRGATPAASQNTAPSSSMKVAPTLSAHGGGLSIGGAF